jgi:DNA methylase/ParB-like nuclease domain
MDIIKRRITDLKQHPKNYRKHEEDQIAFLMDSLQVHAQERPVVITDDDTIIAGHGLVEAARQLGWEDIACVVYAGSNPDGYLLADNKLATMGHDDQTLLLRLLKDLEKRKGLDGSGYTDEEVKGLVSTIDHGFRMAAKKKSDAHAADARRNGDAFDVTEVIANEEAAATLITPCAPNQLWALGRHRILCAEPTDAAALRRFAEEQRAGVVLAHIPAQATLPLCVGFMREAPVAADATLVCVHDVGAWPTVLDAARVTGWDYQHALWVYLPNDGAQAWHSWMRTGRAITIFTKGQGGPWGDATPFQHDVYIYTGAGRGEGFDAALVGDLPHPAALPMPLVKDVLQRACALGGVIFDPFGGTGTILLAAELTGRTAWLTNTDERYVALCIARYEAETGESAVLLAG